MVTLLHDGTSKLLSCQPNIDDYVAQFGRNATTFGRVTQLRAPGRSMSPVATVNADESVMSVRGLTAIFTC